AVIRHQFLSGLPATVQVPVSAYRGVAARIVPMDGDSVLATLELMHADPALSLPLMIADSLDDIAADWQNWSRVLGLPLLLVEADGSLTEPLTQIGRISTNGPVPRRRRGPATKRRPRFLARRKPGWKQPENRLDPR